MNAYTPLTPGPIEGLRKRDPILADNQRFHAEHFARHPSPAVRLCDCGEPALPGSDWCWTCDTPQPLGVNAFGGWAS
jgi:hypothetical protein